MHRRPEWGRLLGNTDESHHPYRVRGPRRGARARRRTRAPLVRVRVRLEPRRHGERRRHARLVAEPAHPLRRHDEDAGRLDAGMGAAAARQPADLPQRELDRADGASRLHGQRERQLGARGREEALRHVHHARQRPGERTQARPLRERRARRRRSPRIRTSTTPCTRRTSP